MSIFSLLKKREAEREVSAQEYVSQAVAAEASGKGDKIDVGNLEAQMQALGWSVADFEAAVEREREINELRLVVNTKAQVEKEIDAARKERKAVHERNKKALDRIEAENERVDHRWSNATAAGDLVRRAEQRLREYESDSHRERRQSLKRLRGDLLARQRELEQRAQAERNTLANVGGVRSPHDGSVRPVEAPSVREFRNEQHRQQFIDAKEQVIAKINGELSEIEAELVTTTEALDQAEAEVVAGVA